MVWQTTTGRPGRTDRDRANGSTTHPRRQRLTLRNVVAGGDGGAVGNRKARTAMQVVPAHSRKLSLQTVDESGGAFLRAAWLGVGSAFAKSNWQTNLFLIKGTTAVLIDAGTLAGHAMAQIGLSMLDVDALLPTHSHADHVGGMEELALKSRYMAPFVKGGAKGEHRPRCIITEEYQQILWGSSLRGGLAFSEEMPTVEGTVVEMRFTDYFEPVRPQPVTGFSRPVHEVDYGGIHLTMMRTKHIPEQSESWEKSFWSCGLVVDRKLFYPGDTRFDEELIRDFVTDNVEAIFHDAQSFPGGVHAAYAQLKALPEEIRRRMYLVHLDDGMLRMDPTAAEAWTAAERRYAELLGQPNTDDRAMMEALGALKAAQRAARDASEAIVREAGFAGFGRDATEVYYDFT